MSKHTGREVRKEAHGVKSLWELLHIWVQMGGDASPGRGLVPVTYQMP